MISTESLVKGILYVLLIPLAILFRAFVFMMLWTWFAVPLGLVAIGMAHAMGLAVLVGLMTFKPNDGNPNEYDTKWGYKLTHNFLLSAFALGFGFIYMLFM